MEELSSHCAPAVARTLTFGACTVKRYASLAVLALAFVTASACGASIPDYDYAKEPDPRTSEYVLGPSDVILVTVWRNGELSGEHTVRPDGTITLPLIGDMVGAGRTPTQLTADIVEGLQKYMSVNPSEITVAVRSVNSYRFTVSGEVVRPGIYNANHYVTVAEAIAMAGGFTRFAERDEVTIMRRDRQSDQVRRIPINYEVIQQGLHPEMNLVIMPGDSVYVP
jgi:polysaccharide biosynthesis/export protein